MNYRKYDIEIHMNENIVNIFCERVSGCYGCFSYQYTAIPIVPRRFNRSFRFYINGFS